MFVLSVRPRAALAARLALCTFTFASLAPTTRAAEATAAPDETGRPVFRNFRPTEYRGHPQVYSVVTTTDGLVYTSSEQGINEYDGIRWRHLASSIPMVHALAATPDGRIWAGGQDGIGYFAPDTPGGEPTYHSVVAQLPADIVPLGRVRSIATIGEQVFFAANRRIVRWAGGRARVWEFEQRFPRLHVIGKTLYAHIAGQGLLRLDGDDFKPVSTAEAFVKNSDSALFPLADGRLLAVVAKAGFFHLDPATGAVTPWATPAAALLRDTSVSAGVRLRDGSFVIGTRAVGLVVVSADGSRVRRLDRNTGLVDNVVLSLAPDPAGGLWVGYNTGTARVELDSPVSVFDGNNGPPSGTIDSWGRHEGVLYAGAYDGLWRLEPGDPATGVGARFTKDPRAITNVFAIEPVGGDTLVAGNIGLGRLIPDGVETLVPCGPNSPLCMVVSRVVPGRVYIGGALGVTVAQKTPAGWIKLAEFHDLGDVHTAAEEADGTVWLATYARGFWRLPQAGAITDWKSAQPRQFLKNCGLPDVIAWTAVFDASGGASLFTDKGSFRLDPTATRCVPEDRFNLPGETRPAIYPFARAANGDGWATVYTSSTLETDYPLGHFLPAPRGPAWQPAPAAALAEIGFAGAAVMALDRTPAGNEIVWARGYHNTVRLALDHTPPPPAPWHATIRSFTAAGAAQPLHAAAAAAAPLRLPFSREPIAFTLAAPGWGAGGDVRFSTRLVGYSDRWSTPSSTAEVSFTNLEGGPFTLEVRATNAEGRTSTPAALTFSVAPPWHRSPVAYFLYGLAGFLAIFAYVRWRLGRSERERRRLEALVAARTTELATARDQAEAANRAKSSFLAAMSHELRTPLNGVIGYAQVLQADTRMAPDQQERLRIVQSSGEHLLRMINDVLDLAKIEAGKIELRPAPFALGDLLADVAAAHTIAAATKGLTCHLAAAADLPAWIMGDAQKLRQILDNLLGNAVKFTATGTVTLRVSAVEDPSVLQLSTPNFQLHEKLIEFSVQDTGPGISPADQQRLFQPFEQARDHRPEVAGTGLGLAISRVLVERLGGHLTLTSTPGVGSTFAFALPLPPVAPDTATNAAGHRIAGYSGEPRRVLIVDDHAVNRRLLVDLLTPLGFICAEYASPETARTRLTHGAEPWPDLAILDLRMDGIDGLELTRCLRLMPRGPQLKILLTTASVFTFSADDARRAGCDDFLPKPFRTGELLEKLGQLLALRWRESDSTPPFPFATPVAPTPLSAATRAALRESLASGDLAAFTAELERLRATLPRSTSAALSELESAAASFQLARLRQLLE